MPQYTLIYFNARGRAEITRWICTYADIQYTDERIAGPDWPAHKAKIPGGKLPVLKVDDQYLTQSLAIARYMAKVGGLVPDDMLDAARCDAVADTLTDMMTEVFKVLFASGDKEEQVKKYKEEVHPNAVTPVMKRLEERFANREYFVSNKITWADLMISLVFSSIWKKDPNVMDGFPKLKAHVDKVCNNHKIKAWNDSNPETSL